MGRRVGAGFGLLLLLAARSSSGGGGNCGSARDCGLLGDCPAGRCVCDAGWIGPTCSVPDLRPAPPPGRNGLFSPTAHSWGGKPVLGHDGQWSLFAAEMTRGCPLGKFNNNSAIRRAVSPHPGGPFAPAEIVFPPFAHNPTVTVAPDGTLLLFYIGAPEHREVDCNGPDLMITPTGASAEPQRHAHLGTRWKPQTDVINMAWSKSVDGPWQTKVILPPATPRSNQTAWNCHASNPSPVVLPSGRVMLMYRGTPCDLAAAGCNSAW